MLPRMGEHFMSGDMDNVGLYSTGEVDCGGWVEEDEDGGGGGGGEGGEQEDEHDEVETLDEQTLEVDTTFKLDDEDEGGSWETTEFMGVKKTDSLESTIVSIVFRSAKVTSILVLMLNAS